MEIDRRSLLSTAVCLTMAKLVDLPQVRPAWPAPMQFHGTHSPDRSSIEPGKPAS